MSPASIRCRIRLRVSGVSERTGERFFSPETVESLQRIVWGARTPTRVIQTPVFEFPSVR